jgi:TRAP-type mannitol/chloroaromatic compound transport system permease small subunit
MPNTSRSPQSRRLDAPLALGGRIAAGIDALSEAIGRAAAWLSLLLVVVMITIVVLRYGLQMGSVALQESVMYINGALFVFGAGYTLKAQRHVRVDIFYSRLSVRGKAMVDCAGALLFLLPAVGFIFFISWDYVALAWRIREGSPETSGLPLVYLLKSLILVLAALLALQGIAELIKSLRTLNSGATGLTTSDIGGGL